MTMVLEPLEGPPVRQLRAEGRILEVLAAGWVLRGTANEVAVRFELEPHDLDACLSRLEAAHWVRVEVEARTQLVIHLAP